MGSITLGGNSPSIGGLDCITTCNPAQVEECEKTLRSKIQTRIVIVGKATVKPRL